LPTNDDPDEEGDDATTSTPGVIRAQHEAACETFAAARAVANGLEGPFRGAASDLSQVPTSSDEREAQHVQALITSMEEAAKAAGRLQESLNTHLGPDEPWVINELGDVFAVGSSVLDLMATDIARYVGQDYLAALDALDEASIAAALLECSPQDHTE
jgi:hypothetical protein